MKRKILIIDDEEPIRELCRDILEKEGYLVIDAQDTETGYKKALNCKPDLIILDLKIQKIGGVELCRLIRSNTQLKHIPIIMLTVESSETDKVIGLEAGADDYVVKPFSPKELVSRCKAVLRRAFPLYEEKEIIKIQNLEVDLSAHKVKLDDKEILLRPKEFELLVLFIKKPGIILSREYILQNVFGYRENITTRTLDTHIKNLRKKLDKFGNKIKTIYSYGFRFEL